MRVDLGTFEARYRAEADPWRFATSPYERHKYATTLRHLSHPSYRRCFEPGCSIGVLTEMLAGRAEQVIACDPSPTATAAARRRLGHLEQVEVVTAAIPEWWPTGRFDLMVLSEIGYYWDEAGLRRLLEATVTSLEPGADLMAVHWLGTSSDHLLTGQQVHTIIESVFGPATRTEPTIAATPRLDGYLVQRWTMNP